MPYVYAITAIYFEWKGSWLPSAIITIISIIFMPLSFYFKCMFGYVHGIVIDQRILLCQKCLEAFFPPN